MSRLSEHLGDAGWVGNLERRFPKFAAGLSSALEVVHADGALDAGFKALCVAAIGAVKGESALVGQYLTKAADAGVTLEQAFGAVINVLISRGIGPGSMLSTKVGSTFRGWSMVGASFDAPPPPDEIVEYFASLYGEVPPNVELAREHAPGVLNAYYLMRTAALEESPLEPRLADLLLCALNAAEYQQSYVEIHARFALRGGATPEQLVEAVACAIPFAGIAAWLPGANGVLAAIENP